MHACMHPPHAPELTPAAPLACRTALDVLRVDSPGSGPPKFAACIAASGFMADVMEGSEGLRALGPLRYDLVGAAKILACRAYPLRISYITGAATRVLRDHAASVCASACGVCLAAGMAAAQRCSQSQGDLASLPPPASASASPVAPAPLGSAGSGSSLQRQFLEHPSTAPERHEDEWQSVEGEFVRCGGGASVASCDASESLPSPPTHLHPLNPTPSVMLIVMPCKSEKTRQGMARYGHLADGRCKLVLVRRCSPLQYLQFLLTMSKHGARGGSSRRARGRTCCTHARVPTTPTGCWGMHAGVFPGQLAFVEVIDCVAAKVDAPPGAPRSAWNLDGELVHAQAMAAEVHLGLLQVFSRGVEA